MLGKLVKYECRSSMKFISLIWLALVVAGAIMGVWIRFIDSYFVDGIWVMLEVIPPILYFTLFVATFVISIIIVLMRFYKGLLSEEGYLMHTLPVKPWQLITAKGIVSGIVVTVSFFAAILSMFLMGILTDLNSAIDSIRSVGDFISAEPKFIFIAIEVVILFIAGILKSIYQIYASMAIGQLIDKYRILLTVGAYIGISTVLTMIGALFMMGMGNTGIPDWFDRLMTSDVIDNIFTVSQLGIGVLFIITLVQLVAFHIVTERILSLKLNLI